MAGNRAKRGTQHSESKPSGDVNIQEIVELLEAASESDAREQGFTTVQMKEATGMCTELCRKFIRTGIESGLLRCISIKKRDIAGRMATVPAYVRNK